MNILKRLPCLMLLVMLISSSTGFAFAQGETPGTGELVARITQTDTSEFPRVTVYVSVTNAAGEPVGVNPSQLVLRENGVEMKPEDVGASGDIGPLSTMLVMDTSGSMNHAGKLDAAKSAAHAYVGQSRPQDFIGLLIFNTEIDYTQPLTKDHPKMTAAIENLKARSDTAMYDALARAIEYLEVVSGRKAIIVMTDGLDNRSKISPQEVIQMIGPEGLSISTVGLGEPNHSTSALSSLDEGALSALAAEAGGVYGYANDGESLSRLYERYGRALQSEYTITYTSPSTLRDGLNRALSVSVEDSSGEQGSSGPPTSYNPGGLLPEVAEPSSWGLVGGLVVALLLLLLVPTLIGVGIAFARSRRNGNSTTTKKSSRIKLKS